MLCMGPAFLPLAAVVDAELTISMPPRLTADTGIDALTHAVEAYVSRKANPFSDPLALTAIQTIGRHLHRAYADGGDTEAREAMMLAATQAGIAFSNSSVALVHGMSRPIGAHFHIAHGLSNAMLFPAVTAFSAHAAPSRYADCARALGAATTADSDTVAADKLVDALGDLCHDLAVPTPHDYGIDHDAWSRADAPHGRAGRRFRFTCQQPRRTHHRGNPGPLQPDLCLIPAQQKSHSDCGLGLRGLM